MKYVFSMIFLCVVYQTAAVNYYIDSETGNDRNDGKTIKTPLKTLHAIPVEALRGGDSVLLASGRTFAGAIVWRNVDGSGGSPVVIAGYGGGKALIDAKGFLAGVQLDNCNHIVVENIAITANGGGFTTPNEKQLNMRCGVLVRGVSEGDFGNIVLRGLHLYDIYWEEPGYIRTQTETNSPNGTQGYGYGIRVITLANIELTMRSVNVEDCLIERVSHTGIKYTSPGRRVKNIQLLNNRIIHTGGPGMQCSGVDGALIRGNTTDGSGCPDETRNWKRGSGMWTWNCNHFLVEHNRFLNANGPGDSAGFHVDFNCENIIVQYNLSANNAGGFCEILGNCFNCCYRYNVSINDGYRVKTQGGAFQEGKILWLSGYVGDKRERTGPFNSYFYNNTIYTNPGMTAKIAIENTSNGVLIVNNIFYIDGESQNVQGDQYRTETGLAKCENPFFRNNLFLHEKTWPSDVIIQDDSPLLGDPGFRSRGGMELIDYIPSNIGLTGKGIEIKPLDGDNKGLYLGLSIEQDIFGNPVTKPHLGAISPE